LGDFLPPWIIEKIGLGGGLFHPPWKRVLFSKYSTPNEYGGNSYLNQKRDSVESENKSN
jgi:hypothetical protein